MKKIVSLLVLALVSSPLWAQKVDSIVFHLYTDSLKKGQYNYINVDGKYSNGKWLPLTTDEVEFSCPTAKFEGNQIIIPENFKDEKVTVKAVLKSNPSISIQRTIWIKKGVDPPLPKEEDVMNRRTNKNKRN